MSYTYAQWVTALANEIVETESRAEFQAILPSCVDYAEQRLYRELDLLSTVTIDETGTVTSGVRFYLLPTGNGRFVVTNSIAILSGGVKPMVPVSLDYMLSAWPSNAGTGIPNCYAMVTDQQFIVGPSPDQTYGFQVIGTIRPPPLSASNTTTYLTLYLPDLWFATTMVFMAGWQQNFGSQSDNPAQATSWETQRNLLLASANIEEQRKRYSSGAWGSLSPTPIATPSR